jgi:hypothetical protein
MAANHPNVGHGCVHLPRLKPAIGTIMFSRQILGRQPTVCFQNCNRQMRI